jgi:ABC-2 type transport system permease protein
MSLAELTTPAATRRGAAIRHRGANRRLLGSEIGLVFRRRRNRALLALLAAAPVAIGIAVKVSTPRGGQGPQFLNQVSNNGLFLVFTALTVTVPLLLPLLVGVVAGDSIAGEAGTGTLRYLLTVPVSRARLLIAKAVGILAFTSAAVLVVAVVGLIMGAALFGLHSVTLLSGDTVPLSDGLIRALVVTLYVILTLSGYLAIGLFISTLTEVPVAAMAATIGVAIVANVLDAVPQLGSLRTVLFTHHWLGFAEILRLHVDWLQLLSWLGVQAVYVALFAAAAWARFTTADITS